MSEKIFYFILDAAVTAGIAAAAVIIARLLIRRAPKKWAYMMWAVVFFRCLCPFSAESGFSLFNAFEGISPADKASVSEALPTEDGRANVPISFDADNAPSEIVFEPKVSAAPTVPTVPKKSEGGEVPQMPTEKKPPNVYTILIIVWICGVTVMALYGVISSAALKRCLKTAVRRSDGVFESDRIATAFTAGLFRPRIYLPCGLPENQRELIILHEQVHIRRRDYILKPLAFAGLALHWFDPLIWAAFALMTRDMEMSCDEAALKICGSDKRTDYSEALLSASVRRSGIAARIGFGETGIKERVKNVLDYKKPKLAATLLAAAVMLTACASVGTDAKSEETDGSAADALKTEYGDGSTGTVTAYVPKEGGLYIDKDGNAVAYGSGKGNEKEYVPRSTYDRVMGELEHEDTPNGGTLSHDEITVNKYTPKIVFDEATGEVKYMEGHPVLSETGGDEAEDSKPFLYYDFGEAEDSGGTVVADSEKSEESDTTEDGYLWWLDEEEDRYLWRLDEEEEAKLKELESEKRKREEAEAKAKELESSTEYQEFLEDIDSSWAFRKLKKPVDSEIIEPYAERDGVGMDGSSFHKGVDFKVKEGDTVCAADGGKVIAASDKNNGYGICVIIDHGNGMTTLYAHLSEASVSVDDEVKQGDEIGKAGHTGNTYGDGLHFEVRIDGQHVDPMDYLDN